MDPNTTTQTVAHIIQLAVAPVFLLAGIAGFLNVLTSRLARIVDRARVIERRMGTIKDDEKLTRGQMEISTLWRRIGLINMAIRGCVMSALLVCMVIVSLFIGDVVELNLSKFIAALFVTAMLMMIAGLVLFLVEVGVSTTRMRQGLETTASFEKDQE